MADAYLQNKNHDKFPKSANSGSSYNREISIAKRSYRPIKALLLPAIATVIKLFFDKLGSERSLSSCQNAKIQNLGKPYHHLV